MNSTEQKYPTGTRVWIVRDLGPTMSHFPKGQWATVLYTYGQRYSSYCNDAYKTYAVDIDGSGFCAWYDEEQLLLWELKNTYE